MRPSLIPILFGGASRALPTLPFAVGAKVMFFGHSFIGNSSFTGSSDGVNPPLNNFTSTMAGDDGWTRALDQRYNIDAWGDYSAPYPNGGVQLSGINGALQGCGGDQFPYSGVGKPGIAPRTPYMVNRRPDIVVLVGGINEFIIANLQTYTDLVARYTPVLDAFYKAGIWVVADTLAPVSSAWIPDADPRLAELDKFNAWLIAQAALRPGLKVNDVSVSFGAASGRPTATMFRSDGLHPTDAGVYANVVQRNAILQTMVSSGNYYDTDPTHTNVYPNATLSGTGGTLTNITGSLADNCAATRSAGTATIVASKEAIDGTYFKQVFTITPPTNSTIQGLQMQQPVGNNTLLASLGFSVGNWLQWMVFIELSAWDGWVRANSSAAVGSSGTILFTSIAHRSSFNTATEVLPQTAMSFWSIAAPFQIPSSSDRIRISSAGFLLNVSTLGTATGNGVVKVSKPILRRITDPRLAWRLP